MPTELVFICLDNFSTELVKKCENNSWKDNLDRQQREDKEKSDLGVKNKKNRLGTATKNKTLNQRQSSWMGNFAQYILGRQTD